MSSKPLPSNLDSLETDIIVSTKVTKTSIQEDDARFNRQHTKRIKEERISSRSVLVIGDIRIHCFEGYFDPWKRDHNREILRVRTIYKLKATVNDLSTMLQEIDLDHYGVVLLDLLHFDFVHETSESSSQSKLLSNSKIGDLSNKWKKVLYGLILNHPDTVFVLMVPPMADFRETNCDHVSAIKDSQIYAQNLNVFRTAWYLGSPGLRIFDINMCFGSTQQRRDLLDCLATHDKSRVPEMGDKIFPFTAYAEQGFIYSQIGRNKILKMLERQLHNRDKINKEFDRHEISINGSLIDCNYITNRAENRIYGYETRNEGNLLLYGGPRTGIGSIYDVSRTRDVKMCEEDLYLVAIHLESSRKRKRNNEVTTALLPVYSVKSHTSKHIHL